MTRWKLFWDVLTGHDVERLASHEQRISDLENKVSVIEGLDAFRHMVGESEQ